ncbi:MAG TPA: hypothetical protein VFM88_08420 [Vicinamibacteria bacterium]|nr:hypothetical protein [Vicinamibacteria bacterium]
MAGLGFGAAAVGFWVLALGRPYGLLIDPASTRAAADAAVIAATGDERQGFVVGSPPAAGIQARLATLGLEPPLLLLLPTVLPFMAYLAVALLIALLPSAAPRPALAAGLWLAFPSSELEMLRGEGFLGAPWHRPEALASFAPVVGALLVLSRARRYPWLALSGAVALAVAWAALLGRPATPERGLVGALLTLTLDQGPFLLLGAWGVSRGAGLAAGSLLMAGSLVVVARAVSLPLDPWCGQTLYRLGLMLASCGPIEELERRVGTATQAFPSLARFGAARVGRAMLVAVTVPASALTWWNPIQMDGPVAERSVEPLSPPLLEAMEWIRTRTDARAVFVASPEYAPAVAAVAGRRVLRAPTLAQPPDTVRRRAQAAALEGRSDSALTRLGVGHLLIGPGDGARWGIAGDDELERRGLRRLFRGAGGHFSVHALAAR